MDRQPVVGFMHFVWSRAHLLFVAVTLACADTARAQSRGDSSAPPAAPDALVHAFTISGASITEASVSRSAPDRSASAGRALSRLTVDLDLARTLGMTGARISASWLAYTGPMLSATLLQQTSNIENAGDFSRLGELYYEQQLAHGRVRLKVGQVDANADFATGDATALFLSAAAQRTPVAGFLPSYPQPVPSVNLFVRATSWLTVGAGVYDGASPDGIVLGAGSRFRADALFYITQAKATWSTGTATVATWHQAGTMTTVRGGTASGATGAQLRFEQALTGTREGSADQSASGVTLVGQVAIADPAVNPVHTHLAVGITARGALGRPAREVFGVLVSTASEGQSDGRSMAEGMIETFYLVPITTRVALQPALDLVRTASTQRALTLAATLRATVTY